MMFNKIFLFAFIATLGCALGNSLISRRSYPMVGTNHCTWGPSYWCGHISRAKECGTLKHCAAVWGQEQLNNPTEVCETCEYFVGGAQKLHAKKIDQKKIGLYMNTLCYQQSTKAEKSKCLADISQYLTEVLQLLDLGLTQRAVCNAINLCPQQKPQKTSNVVIAASTTNVTKSPTAAPTKKPTNKICNDCQVFFKDVRERLQSNETIKNVEELFDSAICVTLGPFRDMCRQLIDAFVPAYLEDVSEFIDPGFLCSIMDFCPESQRSAFFVALTKKSLMSPDMTSDAKECSNCKVFVNNIKKEIDSDMTVERLKEVLEKDVCDHLGNYRSVCRMAVETYAQEILEEILIQINESHICMKLGMCNGHVVMKAVVSHLMTVKFSQPNPFQESTECELCKVLMSQLHSLVEDKQVQKAVKDFLNNEVCVRLGDMKTACLTLVKEYEPLIMKAIQGLLDPKTGCATLGMCNNSSQHKITAKLIANTAAKSPIANTVPLTLLTPGMAFVPYNRVGLVLPSKTVIKKTGVKGAYCGICKKVMAELEKVLKDKQTEKEIEAALDEVCSLLPGSMAKECADFVNEYAPGIIELILDQIKPADICAALQLCSSVSSSSPDALGCSYCSEILGVASGHLSSKPDMTKTDFETLLLHLCTKYGEQFKDMCAPGIQQFGDTVFKALKSDMAPREVCGMIGFCASTAIKPETKHYLGVMCELLKSAGVTTECKEFNQISKEINHNFLKVLLKKAAAPKETNALRTKVGGITCTVCKDVIDYLKGFAVDQKTEEELKKDLHEACAYLDAIHLRKPCDYIVDTYATQLLKMLIDQLPTEEICQAFYLCKKSNTLYFKKSASKSASYNPCDFGIRYRCASYFNAVKCKTLDLCSAKIWKKQN